MTEPPRILDCSSGASRTSALAAAAKVLEKGLPIGLPTDTVYGLAVDPSVTGATDGIFAVKDRPRDILLPVLVGDTSQLELLVTGPSDVVRALTEAFWPGPLTIVMPRRADLHIDIGDGAPGARATIGVRCPAHEVPRSLCALVGPLAVTSANRHGEPDATTAQQVADVFPGRVPLVIDAGPCTGAPSTVVDCTGPTPVLLRPGSISWDDLLGVLVV